MAENVKVDARQMTTQDTGNPVLDSLVNLLAGQYPTIEVVEAFHATLLELAKKEPGGLKRRD